MKKLVKTSYLFEKRDAKYLKQCLKNQKITEKELCEKLGISNTYLTFIKNGARTVSDDLLKRFEENGIKFIVGD